MNILIYDYDVRFTQQLKKSLEQSHEITITDNLFTIKEKIINKRLACPDLIISELKDLHDNDTGLELLKILKASDIAIPVMMIANKSDISFAVECLKLGAVDFIEKTNDLASTIDKILPVIESIQKNSFNTQNNSQASQFTILFVDDNQEFTNSIKFYFGSKYSIEICNDFIAAFDLVKEKNYDCIFLDIKDEINNDDKAGIKLLEKIISYDQSLSVVMLSGWAETSIAVECLKIGANDFIEKSLKVGETIEKANSIINYFIEQKSTDSPCIDTHANKPKYNLVYLVGESGVMKNIRTEINEVANHDVPVLIYGETGTGKEMVASAIHVASPQRKENFVEVDCGSIPESIFESELFGSTKGAFTGAVSNRTGKMELANNGTLFLDEIENLSLEQQAKLLRVIEDKKIFPVGSAEGKIINFRLVCATNVDLQQLVEEGKFREDLFFRMNVYRIDLPPLRERGEEDVSLLIHHFLNQNGTVTIEKNATDLLKKYTWPGNVRELKNLLKKFEIIARTNNNGVINYEIIKQGFSKFKSNDKIKQTLNDLVEYYNRNVPRMLKDFEDIAVLETYQEFNYNISKVAQIVYKEDPADNKNHREKVRKVLERNKHLAPNDHGNDIQ